MAMVESEEVSLQATAEAREGFCCSKCDREEREKPDEYISERKYTAERNSSSSECVGIVNL